MNMRRLAPFLVAATFCLPLLVGSPAKASTVPVLTPKVESQLRATYLELVDAENAHDLPKVKTLFANSPTVLLVAKTRTAEEGNWAGFWGTDTAVSHIGDLLGGVFHLTPDFGRERVALLGSGVAETYVPVQIAVGYGGQSGTPKPFLMIIDWVRDGHNWRIMTDIAIPVPPAPPAHT